MWFAVDAAGPGLRAWPVGDDGSAGSPIDGAALDALEPGHAPVVVDGAGDAPVRACPVAIDDLAATAAAGHVRLPRLVDRTGRYQVGIARLLGALELGRWRDAPGRGRLVCSCGGDGKAGWAFARDGQILQFSVTPTGATLLELLRRASAGDASDEDDDVAYERGLSIAEDARDLEGDVQRVLGEAASGRLRRGAVGATLAGVLIGHDAVRGLGLGRVGAPAALVGTGLLADRYAIALGRFGIAVRRIDPVRALVQGCRAAGLRSDSDCTGNSSH
jgi:hypothetical protein